MSAPKNYRMLYTAEAIAARIQEIAKEITVWRNERAKKDPTDILAIPLLRGGIFFYADLVRALSFSVDLTPVKASSYLTTANVQAQSVQTDLESLEVNGRTVLIIDDICDSGRTLALLTKKLTDMGAAEVRSVTLVKREIPGAFEPTWCGFRYQGDEWMVGYGMDDKEQWRNLAAIYIIG